MHILFLSCFKATELIEKKLRFRLSIKEKLQLKMHKSMCDACTRYEKHSILIEKGISSLEEDVPDKMEVEFLKKLIIKKLENTSR